MKIILIGATGGEVTGSCYSVQTFGQTQHGNNNVSFRLGAWCRGVRWTCVLDTATPDAPPRTFEHMSEFPLQARSVAMLRAELPLMPTQHEPAKIILRTIRHRSSQ
jgi:hypothetical protein